MFFKKLFLLVASSRLFSVLSFLENALEIFLKKDFSEIFLLENFLELLSDIVKNYIEKKKELHKKISSCLFIICLFRKKITTLFMQINVMSTTIWYDSTI